MKKNPLLPPKGITRRSALWTLTGLTSGVIASPLAFAMEKAPKKAPIFALIGDHYHNSEYIRTMLTRDIVNGLGIPVKMTDDYTSLNAETLQGYKMLIVHRDGRIFPNGFGPTGGESGTVIQVAGEKISVVSEPRLEPSAGKMTTWMQPHQGKAVRDFVMNGGSALFFHNVTDVGSSNKDFRDVLGCAYAGHPAIRPFKVKVKRSDHPIMEGITDFIVTDEQHFMEYDKDPKHILMESVNENGLRHTNNGQDMGTTAPAVWAYEYGKGRVCYLEPGHLLTAHWNPMYQKLKRNAVRWLMRQS
jgi:type 1 glutamine amidotransferase